MIYLLIGASLSEPQTNRYYEKIAIVMCVCVSAIRRPRIVLVHVWLTSAVAARTCPH